MSAFVCSDDHINAIATFAETHNVYVNHGSTHLEGAADAATIAGLLYTANVEAVNTRYKEDSDSSTFRFKRVTNTAYLDPMQVIRLCLCFDYQASELDNYSATLACAITSEIVKDAVTRLDGFKAAHYSI